VFHNYIGFWFHKAFSFEFLVYIIVQNINKLSIYCAYYNEECISKFFCLYSLCFWELCRLYCMAQQVSSPSRKKTAFVNVVDITNMQHKMLGACFEGYIVNKYGSADVPRSGFIHIHYDLANPLGYLIITMIVGSNFVSTFPFAWMWDP
jgi:hypothetical protein